MYGFSSGYLVGKIRGKRKSVKNWVYKDLLMSGVTTFGDQVATGIASRLDWCYQ
ncbi:MAG: hypothetical protein ACREBS_00005 [Nitrososphaerales archaeon]